MPDENRVFSRSKPDVLPDQPRCSVGTGRIFCENSNKDPDYKDPDGEYPNEIYPVYKGQSVRQSISRGKKALKEERLTDGQIDFSDFEQVVEYYMSKYGAARNQVIKAMV